LTILTGRSTEEMKVAVSNGRDTVDNLSGVCDLLPDLAAAIDARDWRRMRSITTQLVSMINPREETDHAIAQLKRILEDTDRGLLGKPTGSGGDCEIGTATGADDEQQADSEGSGEA
jgi:hypothetical protein